MTRLSILDYKSRVLACATCAMEPVTTGVTAQPFHLRHLKIDAKD